MRDVYAGADVDFETTSKYYFFEVGGSTYRYEISCKGSSGSSKLSRQTQEPELLTWHTIDSDVIFQWNRT